MAKYELKFLDATDDGTTIIVKYQDCEHIPENDWIIIDITQEGSTNSIWFDKSTAIKFAKALRTEINKMGVYNG
jgi:hypothetical protein